MREAEQFLSQALDEAGIDARVFSEDNPRTLSDGLLVIKDIGEKRLTYRISISTELDDWETTQKRLAIEAKNVKREFEKHLATDYEWGGREWRVSLYDGGWAECSYCGTRVSAPESEYLITSGCELSDPTPVMRDMTHELERMSAHQKRAFELYLLGLLRRECGGQCCRE